MGGLIIVLAVTVLFILLILSMLKMPKDTNIPGPWRWPLIGNAHLFIGVHSVEGALNSAKKMSKVYNAPMNRFWIGNKLIIVVTDPKYIQSLLTHRSVVSKDDFFYTNVAEATGAGVFTRNGELWDRLRKPMMGALQPKNIENFHGMILRGVEILCKDFDSKIDQGPFDATMYIKYFFLDLICGVGVGAGEHYPWFTDVKKKISINHELEVLVEEALLNLFNIKSLLGLKMFSNAEIMKRLDNLPMSLYCAAKKQMEREGRDCLKDEPSSYMDAVLKAGKVEGRNDIDTSMLVLDFIIAGYDTQSVVVVMLVLMFAMHQDYQTKVYNEMQEIFGESDREPTEADLRKMDYLDMCIKECLRHTAPSAVIRKVDDDIEFEGYFIPKGSSLAFTYQMVLSSCKYWERANDFYPDHFLPEKVTNRPKGVFMPFSTGPRTCPGKLYSYQTMKTVLSTLIRRYHLTTDQKYSETQYKYLFMKEPINPLVSVTKRQRVAFST